MSSLIDDFVHSIATTFRPPAPARGKSGALWLISQVWSDYLRGWLKARYRTQLPFPLADRRQLAAAVWEKHSRREHMDIALQWMWDDSKAARSFAEDSVPRLYEAEAAAAIAIIHTRSDRARSVVDADQTIDSILTASNTQRRDDRPFTLIEARRTLSTPDRVRFEIWHVDPEQRVKTLLSAPEYCSAKR